jgi:hypothetical protein
VKDYDFVSEFAGDGELAIGSVVGARSWRHRIDPTGHQSLTGMQSYSWSPGENTAVCLVRRGIPGHPSDADGQPLPVPAEGCTCGFYAYWSASVSRHLSSSATWVGGIVEGYGLTLIGKAGFRCEKARIVALCVEPPLSRGGPEFVPSWRGPRTPMPADQAMDAIRAYLARTALLGQAFGVPVYSLEETMLENHPTTRDYL